MATRAFRSSHRAKDRRTIYSGSINQTPDLTCILSVTTRPAQIVPITTDKSHPSRHNFSCRPLQKYLEDLILVLAPFSHCRQLDKLVELRNVTSVLHKNVPLSGHYSPSDVLAGVRFGLCPAPACLACRSCLALIRCSSSKVGICRQTLLPRHKPQPQKKPQ